MVSASFKMTSTQGLIVLVVRQAIHKASVDLQDMNGEPLEIGQRGIAGPEIVNSQLDTHIVQAIEHLHISQRVVHHRGSVISIHRLPRYRLSGS